MNRNGKTKFKLPPIRPERQDIHAVTSVTECEASISIPRDIVRLNPELDFIMEQQRNLDLCHRLGRKRYYGDIFRQKLDLQWRRLEYHELSFQRTIIAHNRFLRKNLEKRERALLKMQTDQELTKKREKDVKSLKHKYEFLNAVMARMRKEIKRHCIYEDYLNSVVELDESPFKNDYEFIAKYESLQLVKEHCMVRQNEEMATAVLLHDANVEFFRLQDVVLIGLRNGLNNVRCKFDDICRKNLATESLITSIVNRTNEISAEVSTCQYMIDAMYRYMCMRRKLPLLDLPLRDVKPKVDILKSTLAGWEKILSTADITIKGKKKRKGSRKSYAWKQSVSQGIFNWKKKPTPEAEMFQNLMMNSSLFKP